MCFGRKTVKELHKYMAVHKTKPQEESQKWWVHLKKYKVWFGYCLTPTDTEAY
jgi:hypothetical protein